MKTQLLLLSLLISLLATMPGISQQPALRLASPMVKAESGRVANELIVQLRPGERLADLLPYINNRRPASAISPRTVAVSLNMHLLRFDPSQWPGESLKEWLARQKAVEGV